MEFRHRHVTAGDSSLEILEAGDPTAPPVLFLPGRGEPPEVWEPVMCAAAASHRRGLAVDLPSGDGSKRRTAGLVGLLVAALRLRRPVLVGHGTGGMVAYAYLRRFHDLERAVLVGAEVPGVAPWVDAPSAADAPAADGGVAAADAADNELAAADGPVPTPLRYLRGERESGVDLDACVKGFADAGVLDVEAALVPGAGREPHLETPAALWALIGR